MEIEGEELYFKGYSKSSLKIQISKEVSKLMKKLLSFCLVVALCFSFSSIPSSVVAHDAGSEYMSVSYPEGSPCSGFCDYYFANSHFDFWFYWDSGGTFDNPTATINHAHATQVFESNQNGDEWEAERLVISTIPKGSVLPLIVYDNDDHDGHRHTAVNSTHHETWDPGVVVRRFNNSVTCYFEYRLYSPGGSLAEVYHPVRYRQNF